MTDELARIEEIPVCGRFADGTEWIVLPLADRDSLLAALGGERERASQLAALLNEVLHADAVAIEADEDLWNRVRAALAASVVSSTQPEPVSVHVQRDDGPDDTLPVVVDFHRGE